MLTELRVTQLGVIEDLSVSLGPGMTALTGETGAGKTLIVDAIQLLLGGKTDPVLVRPGAEEASVEGRFLQLGDETVVSRVVPAAGRARAYVGGRMASAQQLAETASDLVDLHGQHAHQSLLKPAAQRAGLDASGGISTEEVDRARRRVRELAAAQASLGGDARSRARELDLLKYQLSELDHAKLESADEDDVLRSEEDRLSNATSLRATAASVVEALSSDDGMVDRVGTVVGALSGTQAMAELHDRLRIIQADLAEVAHDARELAETLEDDPVRLEEVGTRRHLLADLRRKYGETLEEVIRYREEVRGRVGDLEDHDRRAAALDADITDARAELREAELRLGTARRASASRFAAAVEAELQTLAMPRARFQVDVGEDPAGEEVTWFLGANPGEPTLPLAKVASGGELARAMLAVRLVLARSEGIEAARPTLIFDEVDAGIGGEAAVAVGRALAAISSRYQVLVVTHLPQVAAFADHHLVVTKDVVGQRTVATAREVDGDDRVIELSRMLSGQPESATARRHAAELLGLTRKD